MSESANIDKIITPEEEPRHIAIWHKLCLLTYDPEMIKLCSDLGITTEDILINPKRRATFARELTTHCKYNQLLDELETLCEDYHTLPAWKDLFTNGLKEGGKTARIFSWLNRMMPDPKNIYVEYKRLQEQYPDKTQDELAQIIINQTAKRAGFVGGFTGIFGGLGIFLVPFDIYYALKYQLEMVQLLAYNYGYTEEIIDFRTISLAVVIGEITTNELAVATERAFLMRLIKLIVRRATKLTLSRALLRYVLKLIPVLGAVVGYFFNYALVRYSGQVISQFFAGTLSIDDVKRYFSEWLGRIISRINLESILKYGLGSVILGCFSLIILSMIGCGVLTGLTYFLYQYFF